MKCIALIVAGGSGQRFSSSLPKQYYPILNRSILDWTLSILATHPRVTHVQVVIRKEDVNHYEKATQNYSLLPPVYGGASRQESVFNGLQALQELAPSFVLVHDAVRPLITHSLIDNLLHSLNDHKGAYPTLPVVDMVKDLKGNLMDRQNLLLVQTPQAFHFPLLFTAHQKAQKGQRYFNDDTSLMEYYNYKVESIQGSRLNIKITTEEDFFFIRDVLKYKHQVKE